MPSDEIDMKGFLKFTEIPGTSYTANQRTR